MYWVLGIFTVLSELTKIIVGVAWFSAIVLCHLEILVLLLPLALVHSAVTSKSRDFRTTLNLKSLCDSIAVCIRLLQQTSGGSVNRSINESNKTICLHVTFSHTHTHTKKDNLGMITGFLIMTFHFLPHNPFFCQGAGRKSLLFLWLEVRVLYSLPCGNTGCLDGQFPSNTGRS